MPKLFQISLGRMLVAVVFLGAAAWFVSLAFKIPNTRLPSFLVVYAITAAAAMLGAAIGLPFGKALIGATVGAFAAVVVLGAYKFYMWPFVGY